MTEAIEIYNGAPFKVTEGNEIWATQKDMATAFEINVPAISKHVNNILQSGELERDEVVSKMEITASDGKNYMVDHYNLDMLIAVGFRVESAKGTAFRRWSVGVLKKYMVEGVAVNPYANMSKAELMRKCADEIEAKEQAEAKVKELVKRNDDLVVRNLNNNALIQQQQTVIDNFAPIGPQPEGTYKRRGSWVNMPKKKPSTPCVPLPIEEPPPYTTEHPTVVPNPESQVVVERNDGQKRQKV